MVTWELKVCSVFLKGALAFYSNHRGLTHAFFFFLIQAEYLEHFGKKSKILDQAEDSYAGPSTTKTKNKSLHKERENFRSTLVNVIMWVV